jgi:hypothetical protein
MSTIRQKIEDRLDHLEAMLTSQKHISDPPEVLDALASVFKFYSVLSEEQREFVQAARWAVEEQREWKTAPA